MKFQLQTNFNNSVFFSSLRWKLTAIDYVLRRAANKSSEICHSWWRFHLRTFSTVSPFARMNAQKIVFRDTGTDRLNDQISQTGLHSDREQCSATGREGRSSRRKHIKTCVAAVRRKGGCEETFPYSPELDWKLTLKISLVKVQGKLFILENNRSPGRAVDFL